MITDAINIVLALPSQHVIFGIISTVLSIAAAWIYSHGSNKLKSIMLETISWLVVFNEIAFQLNMVYYGIWSYSTSLPLEMCYLSACLFLFTLVFNNTVLCRTGSFLPVLVVHFLHLSIPIYLKWHTYISLFIIFLPMALLFL